MMNGLREGEGCWEDALEEPDGRYGGVFSAEKVLLNSRAHY